MKYLLLSVVFGIIQISMWSFIPKGLRYWIFRIPLLAILLNFIGSWIIMLFCGHSAIIGAANMGGSVLFALYIFYFNNSNKEVFNAKRKRVPPKKVHPAGELAGPIVLREKRN